MNIIEIIDAIEARRADLGITQTDLAERAAVSRRTLNGFFAGETEIGLRRLLRIAAALNMTLALTPGTGRPVVEELSSLFHEDE